MRPNVLDPLFAPLTALPGVGPKLEKLFARLLGGRRAAARRRSAVSSADRHVDRRTRPKLRDVVPDTVVTVAVTVDRHRPPPPNRPRAPYQIDTCDDTGTLTLTYFNARKDYLEKLLPVGELRYVSGTTALYDGMLQMVHPDRVVERSRSRQAAAGRAGLSADRGADLNPVRKAADAALERHPGAAGMAGRGVAARNGFPAFADALRTLHHPAEPDALEPGGTAWSRLAYDELLAGQLALALVRAHQRKRPGRGSAGEGRLRERSSRRCPTR